VWRRPASPTTTVSNVERVVSNTCLHCHAPLPDDGPRFYCDNKGRCRQRAHKRRKAGVEVDWLCGPKGARRGRLRLGQLTRAEEQELVTARLSMLEMRRQDL
jgi:hypothetical protein